MDAAFLLTSTPRLPSAAEIAEGGARFSLRITQPDPAAPLRFEIADVGALTLTPLPLPYPEAATSPRGPTAASEAELAGHVAHMMLLLQGPADSLRRRDALMGRVTAAIASACDAVALKLAHGRILHRAPFYLEMANLALETGELPTEVAVDFISMKGPRGVAYLTSGLPRYGRDEVFVTGSPRVRNVLPFSFDLVRWLLESPSNELAVGDAVGRSPSEKLTVRRLPHPTGRAEEVLQVDLPDDPSGDGAT
jgi:hypothetical protein